ncbi:MAG: DUF342 domain-containing protein [Moorea sp. SIO4A3]|nr:DUF342 domain-containing protein [Moorena sp. SIO4A3]
MAFNWTLPTLTVDGKVGIGTDTPSQDLEVIGDIYAKNLNLNGSLTIDENLTVGGNFQLGTLSINAFSSDGNLADNSNLAVPTEKAVKTYVDNEITKVNNNLDTRAALNGAADQDFTAQNLTIGGNLQFTTGLAINEFSGDGNLTDNSDLAIPTEQAVKTYVDNALAGKANLNGAASQNFATNNLTVGGNLRVSGNLEVQGDVIARDTEHIAGNVSLGDQDSDEVKITGVIRSGHSSGALRIDDALHTTGSLRVDGNLSIGTMNPQAKLEVNGELKLQEGVAVNQFSSDGTFSSNSQLAVPTQRAVKTYVDEQIQQLKEELRKTKDELTATKKALESQIISSISSLKNEIETGSIIAQKAAMLQARDENHWMRFNRVDSSNHDLFELWRNDNKWFSTIRVQASDKLLARNEGHWLRFNRVDSSNHDLFELWRNDNQWFPTIRVQASDKLLARDEGHWMRFHRVDSSNHDLFELWRNDNQWFPTIRVQASDKLLARDEGHWMRFNRVDSSNHDLFELWRNDDKWFSTIRVQASDKLLARDEGHWMRHKGVGAGNRDCYGLWRLDDQWFNLIQVAATGNLP